MNTPLSIGTRKGFIIVISLTLMLVMITMGVGLYYSSKQATEQVGINISKSDSFYSSESCIAEARVWLKDQSLTEAPCKNIAAGKKCHEIANTKMSKWELNPENQTFKNRAKNIGCEYTISLLGKVDYEGDDGVGFDIGESDKYGNVITHTKYLYRITGTGTTGSNMSIVEVIDSMIF